MSSYDDDQPLSSVEELLSTKSSKKQVSFYMNEKLYRKFRGLCTENNVSASKVVSALIQDFIERYGK